MNIKTIRELKKMKGEWLVDTLHNNELVLILSVTDNWVRLSNGSSVLPDIFIDTHQKKYEIAKEEEIVENMKELYEEFLSSHGGEIRGLYNDGCYKMGGWNGTMDALSEVAKRYPEGKLLDCSYLPDGYFERLIEEYV